MHRDGPCSKLLPSFSLEIAAARSYVARTRYRSITVSGFRTLSPHFVLSTICTCIHNMDDFKMPLDDSAPNPKTLNQYPNPPDALPEIVVPHAIPTTSGSGCRRQRTACFGHLACKH